MNKYVCKLKEKCPDYQKLKSEKSENLEDLQDQYDEVCSIDGECDIKESLFKKIVYTKEQEERVFRRSCCDYD